MPAQPPISRDIVVVGGPAGSLHVLQQMLRGLPAGFPAAILVVVHQAQSHPGKLPDLLRGKLAAAHARDGEAIEVGRVYVAPPDRHLLVEPAGRIRLSHGSKQRLPPRHRATRLSGVSGIPAPISPAAKIRRRARVPGPEPRPKSRLATPEQRSTVRAHARGGED